LRLRPAIISAILVSAVVLLVVALLSNPQKQVVKPAEGRGRVQCYFSSKDMMCTIERTAGMQAATVCWDVDAMCNNGTAVHWGGCAPAPGTIGAVTVVRVGAAELPAIANCNSIARSSVSNARVQ
jgi:hypothetical protein